MVEFSPAAFMVLALFSLEKRKILQNGRTGRYNRDKSQMPIGGSMKKGTEKGFTLVEIMVVVSIIGILAIIAVPIFVRAKLNANEQMLRGDLRSFSSANESYQTTQSPNVYAPDINMLIGQGYIDSAWRDGGRRHGYEFAYSLGNEGATYSLVATPAIRNITGANNYCVDHTGAVQINGTGGSDGCSGGSPVTTQ